MRALTFDEISMCDGGMSGQCVADMGLNYVITAGAIGGAILTGGLLGAAAIAGAAYSWSGWYRDCGPAASYGDKRAQQ